MNWQDKIPFFYRANEKNIKIAKAKYLYHILSLAVGLKQYQAGYPNNRCYAGTKQKVTYCNVFARDILDSRMSKVWIMGWLIGGQNRTIDGFDYDITCLNKNGKLIDVILNTSPGGAYRNAIIAEEKNILIKHTPESAQRKANDSGVPIWIVSAYYNHEAIVCPDSNKYDEFKGPLIAQAGMKNGIMYMSDPWSWGKNWNDSEIKFYEFPKYRV